MTDQEKLEAIADSMEMNVEELSQDMVLEEIENWDSIAVLSIIAVINDKFNRFPSADEIHTYKTVGDLMGAMHDN